MVDRSGIENLQIVPEPDSVKARGVAMHAGKISSKPGARGERRTSPVMKGGHPTSDSASEPSLNEILAEDWGEITDPSVASTSIAPEHPSLYTGPPPRFEVLEGGNTDGEA